MCEEDNSDRISRLLARPMPRRQALALVGGGLLSLLRPGGAFGQSGASEKPRPPMTLLKMPIEDLTVRQWSAAGIIEYLRRYEAIPISFIAAPGDPTSPPLNKIVFDLAVTAGTIQDVFQQMASQHPTYYTWREMHGRVIFLPRQPQYALPLKGIAIRDVPRRQAAEQYVAYLKKNVSGFDKLCFYMNMLQKPDAHIFTTRVRLPAEGTVLDLFVGLLGENSMNMFTIELTSTGILILRLEEADTSRFHIMGQPSSSGSN